SYTLGSNDVILVDEGTYTLPSNTILDARSQGYTIRGFNNASYSSYVATLNRANTNVGSYALELQGAVNVTLDHLQITGAHGGVYAYSGLSSSSLRVSFCTFYDNYSSGIDLENMDFVGNPNSHATFLNNTFYASASGLQSNGLIAVADDAVATSNLVYGLTGNDLEIQGARAAVNGNNVTGGSAGISVYGDNASVSGNTGAGASNGISVS